MKYQPMNFKVGDWVQKDHTKFQYDGMWGSVPEVVRITKINGVKFDFEGSEKYGTGAVFGASMKFWKLAKNHNILDIINNL